MARMKLYTQDAHVVYVTQNKDPFFAYLTRKIFSEINVEKGEPVLGSKRRSMLDLGCGSGRNALTAGRLGCSALGIDYVKKAIAIANAQAKAEGLDTRVRFIQADITKVKSRQFGLFDYCILNEVIEHIGDYQKVLDFAYSSLKKGGKLILTTPNDPDQWTVLDDYARHVRRFRVEEVRRALHSFRRTKVYTVGFPFHRLIIYVYNLIMRARRQSHQPRSFRVNRFITKAYYTVGTILLTIDDLFTFIPWGTTVVAVAEK